MTRIATTRGVDEDADHGVAAVDAVKPGNAADAVGVDRELIEWPCAGSAVGQALLRERCFFSPR
jgi:hypothetical protein